MTKSTKEIFNDKVSLIYEYNKRSPLFVRAANTEIENNNIEKAINILQNGLKLFPNYPAAYILLGKAFTLLGQYGSALKNFKIGSEHLNSKKTFDFYIKELENIKRQRSLFDNNTKNAFLFEEDEELQEEIPVANEYKTLPKTPGGLETIEQRLGEIAKKIAEAKIPDVIENTDVQEQRPAKFAESNLIVSETLAKIYVNQGEYFEAMEVYKKLIKKNPQKSDYYSQKINEIKSEFEF